MANTSLTLGEYWETFIRRQIASGRYGSASELVRESLRLLEEREAHVEALRAAIIEGENSGPATPFDIDEIKRDGRKAAGLA